MIHLIQKMLAYARKQKMPDVTFKEFFEAPEKYPDALQTIEETILLMKMCQRLIGEQT